MSSRHGCFPPAKPVVCPPIKHVNHICQPQVVPVIHPVEIINKIHTVPIPKHIYTYNQTTVGGANYPPGPGYPGGNGGYPGGPGALGGANMPGYPVGGAGFDPCCSYRKRGKRR